MASTDPVVTAHDLSRTFGSFVAVDRVSFEVTPGEVFGFLGSNGAGKTTTIRMLCGLLAPSSGTATVAGFDVATEPRQIKTRIGYMSQRFSLYSDLTVEENLRFWGSTYGLFGRAAAERSRWAVERAGLEERRSALVRDLPGGYRQRLALGCSLLHQPPVLFLDEPTGGVDPEARRAFWDLIDDLAAEGTTVFVTTHFMDEAERCHRVAMMHAGKLLALDTIPRLRETFEEGTLLEIECERPAAALPTLRQLDAVTEASLFGARLHVAIDEPGHSERVAEALGAAGNPATSVRTMTPSLEDVFIRVISTAERGGSP